MKKDIHWMAPATHAKRMARFKHFPLIKDWKCGSPWVIGSQGTATLLDILSNIKIKNLTYIIKVIKFLYVTVIRRKKLTLKITKSIFG